MAIWPRCARGLPVSDRREAVDVTNDDDVEGSEPGVVQHALEARAHRTLLPRRYAVVGVGLYKRPAATIDNRVAVRQLLGMFSSSSDLADRRA